MRLDTEAHPARHLFSHWSMLRDADKFWRDACAAAVRETAAFIRGHPTCPRPALARHPKGRHMAGYLDVLWLPSADSVAWIDLTHREMRPTTTLLEKPIICTVAVNALAPWISNSIIYRFMRKHGCRPPRVDFRPGDGDTPAAFAHPPALLIKCHVSEVGRWTLQAAEWGLGWLRGETAPFPGGRLPSAHWQAPQHELWTPLARQAKIAWREIVGGLDKQGVARILRNALRVHRSRRDRSRRLQEA